MDGPGLILAWLILPAGNLYKAHITSHSVPMSVLIEA